MMNTVITKGLTFVDNNGHKNIIVNFNDEKIYVKNENSPDWCLHIESIEYIQKMLLNQDKIKEQLYKRQAAELAERIAKQELEDEYNNIDSFADDKSPMQKGKILKTLNSNVLYNGKIYKHKDFIKLLLDNGGVPEIKEYKQYDKDLNFKLKKMYTIKNNNNTFNEINKTSFNYANHLINVDNTISFLIK